VDVAASTLAKLTLSQSGDNLRYFHLENPTSTPWSAIADGISRYNGSNLPLIPLSDWLSKLRERDLADVDKVPVLRLLDFFEHLESFPALSVKNTLLHAPEMDFGSITPAILSVYLIFQLSERL
jgi:hypothetical protein